MNKLIKIIISSRKVILEESRNEPIKLEFISSCSFGTNRGTNETISQKFCKYESTDRILLVSKHESRSEETILGFIVGKYPILAIEELAWKFIPIYFTIHGCLQNFEENYKRRLTVTNTAGSNNRCQK